MAKKKKKVTKGNADKEKKLLAIGKEYAKELTERATTYELAFKEVLEKVGVKFIFQHPVVCEQNFLYILDFYMPEFNVAIELDGAQHYTKQGLRKDKKRTKKLEKLGIFVKRLRNFNVKLATVSMLTEYFERIKKLKAGNNNC